MSMVNLNIRCRAGIASQCGAGDCATRMRRCLGAIFVAGMVFCAGAGAVEVYKDTDSDGPVEYSGKRTPGSERYEVRELPTVAPPGTGQERPETGADAQASKEPPSYEALSVANIRDNELVRANGGNVTVTLTAEPGLDAARGHRFVVMLDGGETPAQDQPTFRLTGLSRGEHSLQAKIVDSGGQAIIRSKPIEFRVKRVSALLPAR